MTYEPSSTAALEGEERRYNTNKQKACRAVAQRTIVPPSVEKYVEEIEQRSQRYTTMTFAAQSQGKTCGAVSSAVTPGKKYNVNLRALRIGAAARACDCGEPVITGMPCVHMHASNARPLQACRAGHPQLRGRCRHHRGVGRAVPPNVPYTAPRARPRA